MIPNIVVDPYLYSPPVTNDLAELRGYVDALLDCEAIDKKGWPLIFNTRDVAEVLAETNSFPPLERVTEIIEFADVDYIQPHDLNRVVNGLITRLPAIEDAVGVDDVLFGSFQIDPERPLTAGEGRFRDSIEVIIGVALLGSFIQGGSDILVLVTRLLEATSGTVCLGIDTCVPEYPNGPCFPCQVNGTIHWCTSWTDLCELLDPAVLWVYSEVDSQYRRSLALEVEKRGGEAFLRWGFDDRFLDSANDHGFLHNIPRARLLLRAAAETILSMNLGATHKLRTGAGPSDPQVSNGNYKAFRRDIDYDFHLHYWQSATEILFASVVIHADMTIPPP